MSILVRKLSVESMMKLIELVKSNPCLYDSKDPFYKDIQKQLVIWTSIAGVMGIKGMKGEDWKKKWRNQRDIYVKKMRKIISKKGSVEAERAKNWCYLEAMSFLEGILVASRNKHDDESDEEEDGDMNDDLVPYNEEDGVERLEFLPPPFVNPFSIKTEPEEIEDGSEIRGIKREPEEEDNDRNTLENGTMDNMGDFTDHGRQIQYTRKRLRRDMEDAFFESCALRMKKLPDQTKSFLQLQISQLFFNAENPSLPAVPITSLPKQSTS